MPASELILKELSAISQTVANLPDRPVFTVPENYFSSFPEMMMARIREDAKEEISLISPLLGRMDKKTPFKVPEGYFEDLEKQLLKPALQELPSAPAPVIHMFRKKQIWKMSVAAAVAGLIGISAWFYFSQDKSMISLEQVNVKAELPKVSDQDMADYLQLVPDLPNPETLPVAGLDNLDIEDMLKNVQDGELQQFISEVPDVQADKQN